MSDLPAQADRGRFTLIDGLRGIAAAMVMLYHFHYELQDDASAWLPEEVAWVFRIGWSGVEIFFVLSGFVIAFAIGRTRVTGAYALRFGIRRSLRLDPPYWASLVLAIAVTVVGNAFFSGVHHDVPSLGRVLAHLAYLQEILGMGEIVPVYWSLCLEIQFYLLLVLGLWVVQRTAQGRAFARSPSFYVVFGGLAALSVAVAMHWIDAPLPGLFTSRWYLFFLGAVTWWVIAEDVPVWIGAGYWLLVAVSQALTGGHFATDVGLLTALWIFVAARRQRLRTALSGPALQYLGRISYSLYLVHPIVGWSAIAAGRRVLGDPLGPWDVLGLFVLGIVASVAAADLFWRLLERPAIAWGRRVRPSAAVAPAVLPVPAA